MRDIAQEKKGHKKSGRGNNLVCCLRNSVKEPYETEGFFGNVIFTNGIIPREDGTLLIYYGPSGETVCLARTSVDEILASLH